MKLGLLVSKVIFATSTFIQDAFSIVWLAGWTFLCDQLFPGLHKSPKAITCIPGIHHRNQSGRLEQWRSPSPRLVLPAIGSLATQRIQICPKCFSVLLYVCTIVVHDLAAAFTLPVPRPAACEIGLPTSHPEPAGRIRSSNSLRRQILNLTIAPTKTVHEVLEASMVAAICSGWCLAKSRF
jgi:hypothetical protein